MPKSIVITNSYGPYNLGDFAIRDSAIRLIREVLPDEKIFFLCESPEKDSFKRYANDKTELGYAPYGYAIRTENNFSEEIIIKLFRLIGILFLTFIYSLSAKFFNISPKSGFYKYITWIKESEAVILMGGGYFITTKPYSDLFGLILNLLPALVAKFLGKKILILPISYGPFASPFHDFLMKFALGNTITLCRDRISLQLAQKHNKHAEFSPDLALYDWDEIEEKNPSSEYVLTFREYLPGDRQEFAELQMSKCVDYLWETYKLRCIFIPTGANPTEENDIPVGHRIKSKLRNADALEIYVPDNPIEAKQLIGKVKFTIGTRMHSVIFSSTVFTPYLALAYQHKVTGLLRELNLEEWAVRSEPLSTKEVLDKCEKLMDDKEYNKFIETLVLGREKVHKYRNKIKSQIFNLIN